MKVGYIPALTFPPKVRPFSRVRTPPPPLATAHSRRAGTVRIAIPDTSKRRMHDGSQAISSSLPPQWQGLSHSPADGQPCGARSWSTRERNLVTSQVEKDQGSAEALWSPIVKTGRLVVREMGVRRPHRSSVVIKIMFVKSNDFD